MGCYHLRAQTRLDSVRAMNLHRTVVAAAGCVFATISSGAALAATPFGLFYRRQQPTPRTLPVSARPTNSSRLPIQIAIYVSRMLCLFVGVVGGISRRFPFALRAVIIIRPPFLGRRTSRFFW
jgi:hypothetical protein